MASTTKLNVEHSAMLQAQQGFQNCSESAKAIMQSLESQLDGLINGAYYQGDQATAFRNLHSQIQDDMNKASTAFNQLGDLINRTLSMYTGGDDQAYQKFNQINSGMPNSSVLTTLGGGVSPAANA